MDLELVQNEEEGGQPIVLDSTASFDDFENEDDEAVHQEPNLATANDVASEYIASLTCDSGLILLQEERIRSAYEQGGEAGLFQLFFTANFKKALRTWTNAVMSQRGCKEASESELDAYLGLELAMSILPLNDISDFWSSKCFLGNEAFSNTMSRTRFQDIRGNLQIHPPNVATETEMTNDPLWHSRTLLRHIQKKFAQLALPYGVSSLDENSIRTKARTKAKSYIPSKPDKYAVRFYAVVGWESLYIHSISDNGSGNSSRTTPPGRYTANFPGLRTPLKNTLQVPECHVKSDSPTALWIAMMGHQTQVDISQPSRRLMICDNFYTRHHLASTLLRFTDGETHILGTVRLQLQDRWNKIELVKAVGRVEKMERGSWELVAAVDPLSGWREREKVHNAAQRRFPEKRRTTFVGEVSIVEKAGYVVFKDKKIVMFYTNDLAFTVPARSLPSSDPRAAACCHGLYPIKRWTGNEILHRRTFMVPTIISAYNLGMNAVDRVDQLRSTNPSRRKEVRLPMSIFTWSLDMCMINAFALYRKVKTDSPEVTLREFKRRVAETLTATELKRRLKRKRSSLEEIVGADASPHILTPNSTETTGGQLVCRLCSMLGKQRRTRWGCTECGRGFHVECFAAFHFRDAFTAATPSVRKALDVVCSSAAGEPVFKTRRRKNNSITPMSKLMLPQ